MTDLTEPVPPLRAARAAHSVPRPRGLSLGAALLVPTRLLMFLIVLMPTLIVVWLSVTDWQPTQGIPWYRAELIGLWNYYDLYYDERFTGAVVRTVVLVAASVAIELGLGVALALLFLDDWAWRKFASAVIVLPMMIVPVDAANAFFMLFNERGPVNHVLGLIAGRTIETSWLADPTYALIPILLAEVWQWTPLMFLLSLSAFMNAPRNQLRAAQSLGASPARIFLQVLLPISLPILLIAALVRAIETFKLFDVIYILTRGGPGTSTETISMFMYNGAFVYFRSGYVAAAALIVLVVVAGICAVLSRPIARSPS